MAANGFFWDIPVKILFGPGCVKDMRKPEIRSLFPGSKAFLVTSSGNSLRSAGVIRDVIHAFEMSETEVEIYEGITQNPDLSQIKDGIEKLRASGADFVVGLGGGSVMDAATCIAGLAEEKEDDLWSFFFTGEKKPVKREGRGLPVMKIPTTAGGGNESLNTAYIVNEEQGIKGEFTGDHPFAAVVDPELHVTVPHDVTAFGAFEALIQSLEGYISKKRTAPAQMMHIATLGNIAQFLVAAIEDGADMDAREKLAFASSMSGLARQLGSTTGLQAVANAVTGSFRDIPHGAVLAICCTEYFKYFLDRNCCDEIFSEMAMSIGRAPLEPAEFLAGLEDLKEAAGLDELRLGDYDVTEEDIPEIAKKACAGRGEFFRNDPVPMSEDDVKKLLESCL